jgi:hypothetical protein
MIGIFRQILRKKCVWNAVEMAANTPPIFDAAEMCCSTYDDNTSPEQVALS